MSKNFFVSAAVTLACLVLVATFPTEGIFQEIAVGAAFFLALPLLAEKYLLKMPLREYGFRLPELSLSIFWLAISLFGGALSLFMLSYIFSVTGWFSPPELPSLGFGYFLLYCAIIGMFSLFYEVFFRGFVMGAWRGTMGWRAVLAQWAVFALFVFFTKQFGMEGTVFLFAAPFAGAIAFFTRSLLPSFLFSWIFVILMTTVG